MPGSKWDPREWERKLMRMIMAQEAGVEQIFNDFIAQSSPTLSRYKPSKTGALWHRNKSIEAILDRQLEDLHKQLSHYLNSQSTIGWDLASRKTDLVVANYIHGMGISEVARAGLFDRNVAALEAFQKRRVGTMDPSTRIWRVCDQAKENVEYYLRSGVGSGRSAAAVSRDIRGMMKNPDKLFRRVRDPETGKLRPSRPMGGYHPGQGVYRSSYKNALRMVRTETNMAYRFADQERWKKMDFVIGYEVKLSGSHPVYDICDSMVGKYPKTFVFGGWHPNCYKEGTEVFTKDGWKDFRDVWYDDQIWTLNPKTKELELSNVTSRVVYPFKGNLIRFHNRSLDLQVTPDHRMIYLNKRDGRVMDDKTAREYDHVKGGFYRSCKWNGADPDDITIDDHSIPMKLFAEFMGYYLSEGCTSRRYAIQIAQKEGVNDEKRKVMMQCFEQLPFKAHPRKWGFEFYDKSFYLYLKQFGKSYEKYIPNVIKEQCGEVIQAFLDGYILGDGSIRSPKSFKGNRGTEFNGSNPERTYFTSSKQLADDIGELILKLGKRPSFKIQDNRGPQKFKYVTYKINHFMWIIR